MGQEGCFSVVWSSKKMVRKEDIEGAFWHLSSNMVIKKNTDKEDNETQRTVKSLSNTFQTANSMPISMINNIAHLKAPNQHGII